MIIAALPKSECGSACDECDYIREELDQGKADWLKLWVPLLSTCVSMTVIKRNREERNIRRKYRGKKESDC